MIHAVTDLRTGETTTYEIQRVGRVNGRIVSNERLDNFRYVPFEHPLVTLVRIYMTALRHLR